VNISILPDFVKSEFYGGRWFASSQAQYWHWHRSRRWMRVLASPLVPLVRLWRVAQSLGTFRRSNLLPRILPALVLGLVLHAAGESVGYALGAGDSPAQKSKLEYDRLRSVGAGDR
jgi:hypothetical protein